MSQVLRQLQTEYFVLSLAEKPADAPGLERFDARLRDDGDIEVAIGPERTLNDLFSTLTAQNMTVVSLRNKANRLEELFMSLVDRKQHDGEVVR